LHITLILKYAAPAKLCPRVVLGLAAVDLFPTTRSLRCVVQVELSQKKEVGPDVVVTPLMISILKSAVQEE